MQYKVKIIKVETGEARFYEDEFDHYEGFCFLWTEGNYSCDCNRAIFFGDDNDECSDGRYYVPHATLEDGTIVPLDDNDGEAIEDAERELKILLGDPLVPHIPFLFNTGLLWCFSEVVQPAPNANPLGNRKQRRAMKARSK